MSGLWLDAAAERSPGSEAVRSGRERVDYKELARRCDVLATELTRAGFQAGDLIATLVPAGIPAIVLFHAARACGLIFVPLNSRLSEAEQRFQLGDAGVRAVVTAGHEHMERSGLLAADMGIGLVHVDAEAVFSITATEQNLVRIVAHRGVGYGYSTIDFSERFDRFGDLIAETHAVAELIGDGQIE